MAKTNITTKTTTIYYITHYEIEIDAHWNFFKSYKEAKKYYDQHMMHMEGPYHIVKQVTYQPKSWLLK